MNFSAAAPFYFILFYIQLLLISKPLTNLIEFADNKPHKVLWLLGESIGILLFSLWAVKHTYILPVHGGGKFLFGGTYLFIYFVGMIFGKYHRYIEFSRGQARCILFFSLFLAIGWIKTSTEKGFVLDKVVWNSFCDFNPPDISLFLYAILVVLIGWSMGVLIERIGKGKLFILWEGIGKLGQHSFYIFLYHLLIISILRDSIFEKLIGSMRGKWVVYIVAVIAFSIAIEAIMDKMSKIFN